MSAADVPGAVSASLLLGALALDQTAVAQVLLSQPLVGGAVLGWAAGDPAAGLLAGAYFQFLCLTDLPVGASVPPDSALAGLIGVAAFLALGHQPGWNDQALLGLLTAGFLPLALGGRALDLHVRRWNRLWGVLAERLLGRGFFRLAQFAALGGGALFFLRAFLLSGVVLLGVAAWGGAGLAQATAAAPAFSLLARCVPLAGLAALVTQRRRTGLPAALAAGVAAGVICAAAVA
ncbi:MAG TPA: PTS sugar transporter subunit IIC [Candidatus Methanoperedens sp.]|nr:PTS sugar transporter subunit IIC [Candidatus Methanoperedens sp.]